MGRALGFSIAFLLAVAVVSCSGREDEQWTQANNGSGRELSGETQVFAESEKVTKRENDFQNISSPGKYAEEGVPSHLDYTDPGPNTDPHHQTPPRSPPSS